MGVVAYDAAAAMVKQKAKTVDFAAFFKQKAKTAIIADLKEGGAMRSVPCGDF